MGAIEIIQIGVVLVGVFQELADEEAVFAEALDGLYHVRV